MSTGTHERPGLFARFRKTAPAAEVRRAYLPGPSFASGPGPRPETAPDLSACKACSPLDYGPCTCPQYCGHLSCMGGRHEAPAPAPVHMVSDETAVMPCCGLTEFQVPLTDCVTMNPRLVTCREMAGNKPAAPWGPWDHPDGDVPHSEPENPLQYEYQTWYGWGTTLLDNRAPMAREYVPEPYTPDLCADLADLPMFREALSQRTRCRAGECLCGHPVTGDTWGERMVRAGIHLLTGNEAAA